MNELLLTLVLLADSFVFWLDDPVFEFADKSLIFHPEQPA